MAEKFLIPQSAMVDRDGHPRPEWQAYLAGIQKISKRLDAIADLAGGATLAETIAKINEILAAYRTTD